MVHILRPTITAFLRIKMSICTNRPCVVRNAVRARGNGKRMDAGAFNGNRTSMAHRLTNGRFATAIDSERDHARKRIECLTEREERYYRAWKVLADANARLEREVQRLRSENKLLTKLKELLNENLSHKSITQGGAKLCST